MSVKAKNKVNDSLDSAYPIHLELFHINQFNFIFRISN